MSKTSDAKRWSRPSESPMAGVLWSAFALFLFGPRLIHALLDGTVRFSFLGAIESATQPIAFAEAVTVLALFALVSLMALIGYSRDLLADRRARRAS